MADNQTDKTKQILEETVRQLYGKASVGNHGGNNYLQGGDGQFLGTISANRSEQQSMTNAYGPYGSKYSPTSIHNPYSKYGSIYSSLSINSPYATNPPILFLNGERRGVVSKNLYQQNRIETDVFLHLLDNDIKKLLSGRIPDRVPGPTSARAFIRAADGAFLGSLDRNPFVEDSIFNSFGQYGSKFSPSSIFNQFGNYGGQFSALSPYNTFTSTPPAIFVDDREVALLTKNQFLKGEKVDPDQLQQWLLQSGL